MIDYKGQTIDLSSEFALLTDTSDDEDEGLSDTGAQAPRSTETALPTIRSVPIGNVTAVPIQLNEELRHMKDQNNKRHGVDIRVHDKRRKLRALP